MKKTQRSRPQESQRHQAAHAVRLYFDLVKHDHLECGEHAQSSGRNCEFSDPGYGSAMSQTPCPPTRRAQASTPSASRYSEAGYQVQSDSPEWDAIPEADHAEYLQWLRYRHALNKEFGILNDVPRAKKSLYVSMVLSPEEIDGPISGEGARRAGEGAATK